MLVSFTLYFHLCIKDKNTEGNGRTERKKTIVTKLFRKSTEILVCFAPKKILQKNLLVLLNQCKIRRIHGMIHCVVASRSP